MMAAAPNKKESRWKLKPFLWRDTSDIKLQGTPLPSFVFEALSGCTFQVPLAHVIQVDTKV